MEELMEELVQESLWDLEAAVESTGEPLDAQGLADFLGDKMMDVSPEYRAMDSWQRWELALKVARKYI